MILVACAVGEELGFLRPAPHVEMLVTGVGVVESASAVSRALAQSRYDLVVSAGIAGAFSREAAIGEGVVVSEELFELGLETGAAIALPENRRVVDRAGSDLALVDRVVELGFRSVRGITVSRVTATDETAMRCAGLGVAVESMEGFAVLRAAEIAGVPAIEVRGISNIACERSQARWDFNAGVRGVEKVLNALLSLVQVDG